LTAHGIDWISYTPAPILSNASIGIIKSEVTAANLARVKSPAQFYADAEAGTLPPFSFIDPDYTYQSEENPQDVQVGERFLSSVVHALMKSPAWPGTALFITYDEGGGYYDHVPPPRAIRPDRIAPIRGPGAPPLAPGGFDRYGFRVPLYVVSPWARANYVSNVVQDHTSVTAFIERKWNLPAMTFRDANAHPMTDYFDFRKAAFAEPPQLANAPGLAAGLRACHAHGYNPPLPPGVEG
jgi:phospholipase C